MPLLPGARLGHYEIVDRLGAGGMGEVYRAKDTRLGREVAIKILPEDVARDPDRLARFEREAKAVSALNHPHIVTLHEAGTSEAGPYFVLEKIDGHPLRQVILAGPMPLRRVLTLGAQIADALAKAHSAAIVHRDLKPDNVMVTVDGFAKILDFGLAQIAWPELEAGRMGDGTTLADLTESGVILGTIGYLSPEQAAGKPADFRADQFALGALLYEMAAGERPFHRDTVLESLTATIREEPEPLRSKRADVPPQFAWLVERCLAKNPNERYASTRDLARDLGDLRDHLSEIIRSAPEESARVESAPRSRPWRTAALVVAGLTLGAVATLLILMFRPSAPLPSYRPLTFRRGVVSGARFSPDGKTVYYSAAFDGGPARVYVTRLEGTGSELVNNLDPAVLLSVSRNAELAVLFGNLRDQATSTGMLARVPAVGGTPRPVAEGVWAADWAPDGELLVKFDDRFEFPMGHKLTALDGRMPRLSRSGDRIALIVNSKVDESVEVEIADRNGNRVAGHEMGSAYGLAWALGDGEVWFTGSEVGSGYDRALWALSPSGKVRVIARGPGAFTLHDIAPDGKSALVASGAGWNEITAVRDGQERSLDLRGRTNFIALSADGDWMLAHEGREVGGGAYLRSTDGKEPIFLGDETPLGISSNGNQVLVYRRGNPSHLVVIERKTGNSKDVSGDQQLEPVRPTIQAQWSQKGDRLFASLKPTGGDDRKGRIYFRDGDHEWQPVTPEGIRGRFEVTPDGRTIAARGEGGIVTLFHTDGTPPIRLEGEIGTPVLWSSDNRWLFLRKAGEFPVRIYRRDLQTGRIEPWRDVAPTNVAGVMTVEEVLLARDGAMYIFRDIRASNELYLATGLR